MYVGRLRLFFKIALSVFLVLICWLNWPRSHLWKVFLQVECSVVVNLPFEQAMLTSIPKLNSQKTNKKNYYADKARSLTFGFVHNRFGNKISGNLLGWVWRKRYFQQILKCVSTGFILLGYDLECKIVLCSVLRSKNFCVFTWFWAILGVWLLISFGVREVSQNGCKSSLVMWWCL